jgi:hypothetical protein
VCEAAGIVKEHNTTRPHNKPHLDLVCPKGELAEGTQQGTHTNMTQSSDMDPMLEAATCKETPLPRPISHWEHTTAMCAIYRTSSSVHQQDKRHHH